MLRVLAGFLILSSLAFFISQEASKRSISKRDATTDDETNERFCKQFANEGDQLRFCGKRSLAKAIEFENQCTNKERPRKYRNNVELTEACCTNTCTERQIKCFICDE
ncbi:hypothetical protein PRIPAC_73250 [Pristionchus pacificus]|uniref:Uncharacterized protein n=1 Tax=Pristionchus pacificus TaxID=54126 RepID=A0A2A6C598_PRIPA|nr:hypothetical protein PRIPAC_73250 [Pristionchus pacificus]|eukprot:PDM73392.1 hypothetical protein PRIPAC_40748 [Pristionchus pacificus]